MDLGQEKEKNGDQGGVEEKRKWRLQGERLQEESLDLENKNIHLGSEQGGHMHV